MDLKRELCYFNSRFCKESLGRFINVDPAGLKLTNVDEAAKKYKYDNDGNEIQPETRLNPEEQKSFFLQGLSEIVGAEMYMDENGFIQMGEIIQRGEDWYQSRQGIMDLIDSDEIVGLATNKDSKALKVLGDSDSSSNEKEWMARNDVDAGVCVNPDYDGFYYSRNPNYKGRFNALITGERSLMPARENDMTFLAHELGHAVDFVRMPYDDRHHPNTIFGEDYAQNYQNNYYRAINVPPKHNKRHPAY